MSELKEYKIVAENPNLKLDWKYIGGYDTPKDMLHYTRNVRGVCGECAIAAVLGKTVKEVFQAWGKDEKEFRHYTSQKEMKEILSKLGYAAKQKGVDDPIKMPECDLAIVRVSFGDYKTKDKLHWMEVARRSHYIGLKRFRPDGLGIYVFDNFETFDGKETTGLWIETSEYYKVMANEKMFITSYLELKPNEVKELGIPPNSKELGILPTIL